MEQVLEREIRCIGILFHHRDYQEKLIEVFSQKDQKGRVQYDSTRIERLLQKLQELWQGRKIVLFYSRFSNFLDIFSPFPFLAQLGGRQWNLPRLENASRDREGWIVDGWMRISDLETAKQLGLLGLVSQDYPNDSCFGLEGIVRYGPLLWNKEAGLKTLERRWNDDFQILDVHRRCHVLMDFKWFLCSGH